MSPLEGEILAALSKPSPVVPMQSRLGMLTGEYFEYQRRMWPLDSFAAVAQAAAEARRSVRDVPENVFISGRVRRVGFEVLLLRDLSPDWDEVVMRGALVGSSVILYTCTQRTAKETFAGPDVQRPGEHCDGFCGILETGMLGHRFQLFNRSAQAARKHYR